MSLPWKQTELTCLAAQCSMQSPELKRELARRPLPGRLLASIVLHAVIDVAVIYAIWSKLL